MMQSRTGRVASATLSAPAPERDRVAKATPPAGARLHRNNAAEWVMVVVLFPFVWIARRMQKNREEIAKMKKAKRSAVMIEGLPPRTMN